MHAPGAILRPGQLRPMGPRRRALAYALLAGPVALVLGIVLGDRVVPRKAFATQVRDVFSQASYMQTNVRAAREGRRIVWGRRRGVEVPLQTMTLTAVTGGDPRVSALRVDLPGGAHAFTDAAGSRVAGEGPFEAADLARWLNAQGHTDPRVEARAADMLIAIGEMDDPTRTTSDRFTRLHPDPERRNRPSVVAHPTYQPPTVMERTAATRVAPYAIAALLWLCGLPLVLREPRRHPRVATRVS